MKHRKQEPSSRRVQAFIKPVYYEKLKSFGYIAQTIEQLMTKFWTVATILDNGKMACLICHPWHKYCPDYDQGYDVCDCKQACDFNTEYLPQTIFDTYNDFHKHFMECHNDTEIPKDFIW